MSSNRRLTSVLFKNLDLDRSKERPSWQKNLLAIPTEQRTQSQIYAVNSSAKLESAAVVLSERARLDLKDTVVVKSIYDLVEVLYMNNGGETSFKYYLSAETVEKFDPMLRAFCLQIFDKEDLSLSPQPKQLVPLLLLAVIALEYICMTKAGGYCFTVSATATQVLRTRDNCLEIVDYITNAPNISDKCNRYMDNTLQGDLPLDFVLNMVRNSYNTANCAMIACAFEESAFHLLDKLTTAVKERVQNGLAPHPIPLFRKLAIIYSINYQISLLGGCYIAMTQKFSVAGADVEWWEVAQMFIKLLEKALKETKEHLNTVSGSDSYMVAVIARMQLENMLRGTSKFVSYNKVQRTCNEMAEAAAANYNWVPVMWKEEVEELRKLVENEVLPYLQKANKNNKNQNAAVHVYTPGYLELFTPATTVVTFRKCAACGTESINLLKCSGVSFEC